MDEREGIPLVDERPPSRVRRRWSCPSDTQVASYLEQRLGPKERSRFEAHLADCDFCLAAIGDVVRQQRASEVVEVPNHLLHKAIEALPVPPRASFSWNWLLAPALASIVIISIVLLRAPTPEKFVASTSAPPAETARPQLTVPQSQTKSPEKQYVRRLTPVAPGLQLLKPRSGSLVEPHALKFGWKAVADAAYYEIRLVNAEGDLVWRGQAANADAQLPPDVTLQPGKYFFWVHAYLNSGRTLKSDATAFWVRKPS